MGLGAYRYIEHAVAHEHAPQQKRVPSIPARRAYSALYSVVAACCRALCNALYCCSGRSVTVRRCSLPRVHKCKLGQVGQSERENLILMTALSRPSIAGVQELLVLPSGQVATCFCQSIRKSSAANPLPA